MVDDNIDPKNQDQPEIACFDDQSVRELLAEAGRTWQVLQHDLDAQLRRPRA